MPCTVSHAVVLVVFFFKLTAIVSYVFFILFNARRDFKRNSSQNDYLRCQIYGKRSCRSLWSLSITDLRNQRTTEKSNSFGTEILPLSPLWNTLLYRNDNNVQLRYPIAFYIHQSIALYTYLLFPLLYKNIVILVFFDECFPNLTIFAATSYWTVYTLLTCTNKI